MIVVMMIKFFRPSERGKKEEWARVGGFCMSNTNHQHVTILSTSLFSFGSLLLSYVLSSLYNNRGLSYKMKVIILFKDRVSTVRDQHEVWRPVVLAPSQILSFSRHQPLMSFVVAFHSSPISFFLAWQFSSITPLISSSPSLNWWKKTRELRGKMVLLFIQVYWWSHQQQHRERARKLYQ